MNLVVIAGSANPLLADAIVERLAIRLGHIALDRFPDSELHAEVVETVRGCDVYLIQPTGPLVDSRLVELLFLADACRRAGAARLTAVIPYFAYARQDRRARGREAVGARLVADLLRTAGFDRIVAVDLHSSALEGFFSVPIEHLTAIPLLANAVEGSVTPHTVIVAPDLGAAKLAERYAEILHRPIAIVHKTRISGAEVKVRGIVGDVLGRAPLIVDDMISTGGTIAAAADALLSAGCAREITVVASHGLLVGPAIDRLSAVPLKKILVTDSLPIATHGSLPLDVIGLAPTLAEAISRLNVGESLADLIGHR